MTQVLSMPVAPPLEHYRFTVDDYHRMGEAGILTGGDRVELLDGRIIEMSPIGPDHGSYVDWLLAHFADLTPRQAILRVQGSTVLQKYWEPQPDLMLLRPRKGFYRTGHPTPEDILLLVEVSDSSVRKDREVKLPSYAQAGVAEAWIVNIGEELVEVYRQPVDGTYSQIDRFGTRDTIAPLAFPNHLLKIEDLFDLRA